MNILITGGAGYIGSHATISLLEAGHSVSILDNLLNSSEIVLDRIGRITDKKFVFYRADLLDGDGVRSIFRDNDFDLVMHFAGLKAVGDSVRDPLSYYSNNIVGTLNLLGIMSDCGVKKIVFSSSATVYGEPHSVPIKEDFPLCAVNPYGQTKLTIEYILRDVYNSDNSWGMVFLRYFNPIGAHSSGLIGESPSTEMPNNIMPYISQVAVGKLKYLSVFGDDYDTKDGTGVRDYIHVVDLADGHLRALEKIENNSGLFVYNLGTGKGYSVLDLINAFEAVSGEKISYKVAGRRPGDIAKCYADVSKAERELGFKARYNLDDMCKDSWNWQMKNRNGYEY